MFVQKEEVLCFANEYAKFSPEQGLYKGMMNTEHAWQEWSGASPVSFVSQVGLVKPNLHQESRTHPNPFKLIN